MSKCAQQGQSCVTACSASAVLRYCMLGECCHVVVCSLKAVLRYGMIGECCLVSKHAQRVQSCVTPNAVSSYRMLEECSLVLQHN